MIYQIKMYSLLFIKHRSLAYQVVSFTCTQLKKGQKGVASHQDNIEYRQLTSAKYSLKLLYILKWLTFKIYFRNGTFKLGICLCIKTAMSSL